MASGRPNGSGTKGFNFASDDILCSYEDFENQDGSNGRSHSDPAIGADSSKEFRKTRMARSSSMFPSASYSPPEESSLNQDMISAVDKSMKKYADNLMRFLEGISSRLSELELYCYNLDKSIGEMRSDLNRDHGEADSKLISIEKHLQEVHRSVQILRDKQELADTQKELTKLQVVQKEPSNATNSQQNEERVAPPPDVKKGDNTSDMHGQQLALSPPHQAAPQPAPQPSLPSRPAEQPQQPPMAPAPPMSSQSMMQSQGYYLAPAQMTNLPGPTQVSQGQYMHPNSQYQATQMQDQSRVDPHTTPSQLNQSPHPQSLPQYQQQWSQQVQQLPQSAVQPQVRPSSAGVYPSYVPSQPNPPPQEMVPNSSPMQGTYSGVPPSGASRSEPMPYGYGGPGRPVQPQPPSQHLKPSFSTQPVDGYAQSGSHPALTQGNTYTMYDEGGRPHQPHQPQPHQPHQPHQPQPHQPQHPHQPQPHQPQQPHQQQPHQQQLHQQQPHHQPQFSQGGYPPSNLPVQNPPPSSGSSMMNRPPQFARNLAYNELIDKLVSMGYRGDHVVSVIQRLEESGQTVDFNSVLDKLNGHSSGGSQRGWSG